MSDFDIPADLAGDALAVALAVHDVYGVDGADEISDACARTIASWWHDGQATAGYAFVSTGAITTDDPSDLWRELGGSDYHRDDLQPWERAALDCLATYLANRKSRDPVPGWSGMWVR